MRTKRVYIAMPYTSPDPVLNLHRAIEVAEHILLYTDDWHPFIPHLFHIWHLVSPHDYEYWMERDKEWMQTCHAVLAPSTMSEGVKRDVNCGEDLGLPLFLSVASFMEHTKE